MGVAADMGAKWYEIGFTEAARPSFKSTRACTKAMRIEKCSGLTSTNVLQSSAPMRIGRHLCA